MNSIFSVLTQNIFPIFIVAGFGFALQRWTTIDKRSLSSAVLYVLSPCLVFGSLVGSELPSAELGQLALFAVINILLLILLGWLISRLLRLPRAETAAFMLVVAFVNAGNYGLTLNQLRYGNAGLSRAIVYYTASTIIVYTIGLLIATMGKLSWRDAFKRLLRLPPIYAAVLAVVVYVWEIPIPTPIMRGIEVAGNGAIPVLLLVLGMQLASLNPRTVTSLALPAAATRLVLGPLIGIGVATLVGLEGLGRATSIVEASMPTAVLTIVLATEFDLRPDFVTSVVVLTTLGSPITVATTITLLGL